MLKKHLMETVTRFGPKYNKYNIEKMGEESRDTVLLMPS
jgi:hypothetical protein